MRWWWMRMIREQRGQSLVETALSLPLLAFLLLGGADMARGYAIQLAVQNGARAGAEAAAIDYSPTTDKAKARAKDEIARTPGLDPNAAIITATFAKDDGVLPCPAVLLPDTACYAIVEVRYTFRTVTPWPLIPNVFTLDRTTSMRMFVAP